MAQPTWRKTSASWRRQAIWRPPTIWRPPRHFSQPIYTSVTLLKLLANHFLGGQQQCQISSISLESCWRLKVKRQWKAVVEHTRKVAHTDLEARRTQCNSSTVTTLAQRSLCIIFFLCQADRESGVLQPSLQTDTLRLKQRLHILIPTASCRTVRFSTL
jgi:hypothetical protein